MPNLPINANICEMPDENGPGAYYPVRLDWVPRVGELIDLYSYLEQAAKKPPTRHYEVISVVHHMRDIAEDVEISHKGAHFVSVYVKPTTSILF